VRIAFLLNGMTGYLDAEYRQLHKLGDELLVVSPGSGEAAGEAMADTAFRGLDTEEYAQVVAWERAPRPRALVRTVLDFDPDAVLMTSWNYARSYRAVMRAVRPDVVRVIIMDNLWRAAPRQWLGRALHRFYVNPVADAAFVPGDRTEFYARRLGFGLSDIIRGSLSADVDLFHSGPRTGRELAARRAFLYVGRLVWHKGPDLLGAAYRRYLELTDEPWDLHIAGTGPLDEHVRSLPGVTMHGFLQPPQIADLMRSVSCFALTSHIEPYGVVVHEAAAAGLPILCTEFSGAGPSFVQDAANGWLVPAGDVEAWAQAMLRMSSSEESRLAAMSDVSRSLARRTSPAIWALNLHEQLERRRAAGGGRLTKPRGR
jgi:glycosyltransferase involved in cell wall biosynthesis